MKILQGDLLEYTKEGYFDVIVHGCNCFNNMGGGIAKQIKTKFPEVYIEDCKTKKGDKNKLGTYSFAQIQIGNNKVIVINAYTQYHYAGRNNVDYKAIDLVFKSIKNDFYDCRIGFPKIGAGLAGGDWQIISKIISETGNGMDYTLVEYV